MNQVFSYGEIGVDNIVQVPHLPSPETAAFPVSDTYHIGGAAANYAVLLAHWNVPVGLSGNAIGDDVLGRQLLDWLSKYSSLDIDCVSMVSHQPTPFCRILVTPDGERSILVYHYTGTPCVPLTGKMLAGVQFLALDLYGYDERTAAAKLAREHGVRTIVNDLISPSHPTLPYADIIVNSAAYVRSEYPDLNPLEHAVSLHNRFDATVITTDGPRPVSIVDGQGKQSWLTPPVVTPVDATGAGDAFRAGLTYGLLQGWDTVRATATAIAAGSLKVSRLGAVTAPPALEEVLNLMDEVLAQCSS